jgi:hypothetical protein
MDAETLEALRGSIAKWEAIVAGKGKDKGCANCPLCLKFNRGHIHRDKSESLPEEGPWNCAGCPVAEVTRRDYCEGSPYERYNIYATLPLVALEELAFLKSLLPPGIES